MYDREDIAYMDVNHSGWETDPLWNENYRTEVYENGNVKPNNIDYKNINKLEKRFCPHCGAEL